MTKARTRFKKNLEASPPLAKLPMVRTSERGTFKKCRWLYEREFMDLVKPKTPMPALRFGSLVHQALAEYYIKGVRRGVHPRFTFEKLYEADVAENAKFGFRVDEDEKWQEAGHLGVEMLDHYVDHYGKDGDWEVLVTEQPFQTLVNHPVTNDPWFWYVGVVDGVWKQRSTGLKYIVDHKTAASIRLDYLRMDDQAGAYWTFGLHWLYEQKLLARQNKLAGLVFNFMRKAARDVRKKNAKGQYLNQDGSVSKKQPPPHFVRHPVERDEYDREQVRRRASLEFHDIERVRAGEEPVYKNPGQQTCTGCWALDICELHEIGQDWQGMMQATTKPWSPYDAHEIYDRS